MNRRPASTLALRADVRATVVITLLVSVVSARALGEESASGAAHESRKGERRAGGLVPPVTDQDLRPLSLRQFIAVFEKTDPRLEALEARIARARAETTAAEVLPNPTVAYDREEVFASGARYPENYLRASLPIEVSGRRGRRIAAAEVGVVATEAEVARERALLLFDAAELYYDAALARLRLELLKSSRAGLGQLLDVVRSRAGAGEASGYDLGRLEIEIAFLDDLLADAERTHALFGRTLAGLMSEPEASYDATDPLDIPAQASREVRAFEIGARQDHRAMVLRIEQAEEALSASSRAWVPSLLLSGGLKTSDLGAETAIGYVAGIALSIPIFDHGQGDRDRALAEKQAAAAEARALERLISISVRNSYDDLSRRVLQATQYQGAQLPRLDELLRRAELSYQEGERPIFELLDAYRTAREIRLRDLELRRGVKSGELELLRALGQKPLTEVKR